LIAKQYEPSGYRGTIIKSELTNKLRELNAFKKIYMVQQKKLIYQLDYVDVNVTFDAIWQQVTSFSLGDFYHLLLVKHRVLSA
jgi:uncharacterized protein VirK/YbjX